MKADLHIHTTASDGSLTPTEVVRWAKANGLEVIAVTDHDTVCGVYEAQEEGKRLGVKVLSGIELSTFSNCEIHMLGYNIDYQNPLFLQDLEGVKGFRKTRNLMICEKLNSLGIRLDLDFESEGAGRMNIARSLVKDGFATDINNAFEKYLGINGKAYCVAKRMTPMAAVSLIKKYGGFSSIAHPKKYLLDKRLEILVSGLKQFGLDGIEISYPNHTFDDQKALSAIAERVHLLPTGGSDFHGDEDKNFTMELDPKTQRALHL